MSTTIEPGRFDAVGNPLAVGDRVCVGWRDSRQPKRHVIVISLESRLSVVAADGVRIVDYRDVIRCD